MSFLSILGGEFSSDDAFLDQLDVIRLLQGEELSDFVGTLGAQSSGDVLVSDAGDLVFTLGGNGNGKDGDVVTDDATSDRFSLSFTFTSFSEAFLVLVHHESDSTLT